MNRTTSTALTGLAVTMAVGTAAYMMSGKNMKSQRKALKKNAGKAIRTVGNFIDNVSYMMK